MSVLIFTLKLIFVIIFFMMTLNFYSVPVTNWFEGHPKTQKFAGYLFIVTCVVSLLDMLF